MISLRRQSFSTRKQRIKTDAASINAKDQNLSLLIFSLDLIGNGCAPLIDQHYEGCFVWAKTMWSKQLSASFNVQRLWFD